MKPAEVHAADLRTTIRRNLFHKIDALLAAAGLGRRVHRGDLVAVKIHFGEAGNTAFIRPVFVRRVVDAVKELGGRPFLTDANTLYVGSRTNAVDHLETAIRNGFAYAVSGAPLVVTDGLRGTSSVERSVDGVHFRSVHIGAEFVHADAAVVLSHVKGHELAGFGGALKNLGMGCACRKGKMAQHSTVSPKVDAKLCVACGECLKWCASGAIKVAEAASIDDSLCVGCGECIPSCPQEAIQIRWTEGPRQMQEKMAEYAAGALQGKEEKSVFLNFLTQVSPACDCMPNADVPVVGDVGILCATDPVAIDQASVDLVNLQPGRPDSALKSGWEPGGDKFRGVYPEIDWAVQLVHAEKMGLGTRAYTLHTVK